MSIPNIEDRYWYMLMVLQRMRVTSDKITMEGRVHLMDRKYPIVNNRDENVVCDFTEVILQIKLREVMFVNANTGVPVKFLVNCLQAINHHSLPLVKTHFPAKQFEMIYWTLMYMLGYKTRVEPIQLTEEQRAISDATLTYGNGVKATKYFVNAGPGTGKTTMMAETIYRQCLRVGGVNAKVRVLVLTYTNSAAANIAARLARYPITIRRSTDCKTEKHDVVVFCMTIDKFAASINRVNPARHADQTEIDYDQRVRQAMSNLITTTLPYEGLYIDEAQCVDDLRGAFIDRVYMSLSTTTINGAGYCAHMAVGDPKQQIGGVSRWFTKQLTSALTRSFRFKNPAALDYVNALSSRYEYHRPWHVELVGETDESKRVSTPQFIEGSDERVDNFLRQLKFCYDRGNSIGVIAPSYDISNAMGQHARAFVEKMRDLGMIFINSGETTNCEASKAVSVLTMHGAAGHEFDYVVCIAMAGYPESAKVIESSQAYNLTYIAQTRARSATFFVMHNNKRILGVPMPAQYEIPNYPPNSSRLNYTLEGMSENIAQYFETNRLPLPPVMQLNHPRPSAVYAATLRHSGEVGEYRSSRMTPSGALGSGAIIGGRSYVTLVDNGVTIVDPPLPVVLSGIKSWSDHGYDCREGENPMTVATLLANYCDANPDLTGVAIDTVYEIATIGVSAPLQLREPGLCEVAGFKMAALCRVNDILDIVVYSRLELAVLYANVTKRLTFWMHGGNVALITPDNYGEMMYHLGSLHGICYYIDQSRRIGNANGYSFQWDGRPVYVTDTEFENSGHGQPARLWEIGSLNIHNPFRSICGIVDRMNVAPKPHRIRPLGQVKTYYLPNAISVYFRAKPDTFLEGAAHIDAGPLLDHSLPPCYYESETSKISGIGDLAQMLLGYIPLEQHLALNDAIILALLLLSRKIDLTPPPSS